MSRHELVVLPFYNYFIFIQLFVNNITIYLVNSNIISINVHKMQFRASPREVIDCEATLFVVYRIH